jgi:hypothetical protein
LKSPFLFRRERKAAKKASPVHESPDFNPMSAQPTVIFFIKDPQRARLEEGYVKVPGGIARNGEGEARPDDCP